MKIGIVVKKCEKHRRYKPFLRPRCDCVVCWSMFIERTLDYQIICQEIDRRSFQDTGTFIAQFDPRTDDQKIIFKMLCEKRDKMEEN